MSHSGDVLIKLHRDLVKTFHHFVCALCAETRQDAVQRGVSDTRRPVAHSVLLPVRLKFIKVFGVDICLDCH
jgi:hypothetical protein